MAVLQWHWRRHCIFVVQVSQKTEPFTSTEFYADGYPEMAIHWWQWTKLCTFIVQVSQETRLFMSGDVYSEDELEMTIYCWHWAKCCTFIVYVYQEIVVFKVERSLTRKMALKWLFVVTWRILHDRCLGLLGHRALWVIEFYSEDGIKIAIHQTHWGRLNTFSVEVP